MEDDSYVAYNSLDEIQRLLQAGQLSQARLRSIEYFNKIPSTSSRDTATSTLAAQAELWSTYLGDPASVTTLISLLAHLSVRQYSSEFVLSVGRLAVDDPNAFGPLFKLVARVPRLNDSTPIIAPVITALIKQNVDTVEIQRLALGSLQKDPEAAKHWPGYLWERTMIVSDFETCRTLLDAYRALALPTRLGLPQTVAQESGTGKEVVQTGVLTYAQVLSISKPYTGLLRAWIRQFADDPSRISSPVPGEIAQEYLAIIGKMPIPTSFLNSWMNAERLAGNIANAESIWNMFDTSSTPSHSNGWPRSIPDKDSWVCWMKMRKSLSSPIPHRESVRRIVNTLPQEDVSTTLLNAVLSSMVTTSQNGLCDDLPLLLLVLRSFAHRAGKKTKNRAVPNGRTIDIVGAGIIRLWHSTGQYLDRMLVSSLARTTREQSETWCKTYRMKWAIHPSEWKLVSLTISELLPLTSTYRAIRASRSRSESLLPFGERAFHETKEGYGQRHPTYNLTINGSQVPVVPPHAGKMALKPVELLKPLMALVERAIRFLLAERIETDEQLEEAFERLMDKVWEDVMAERYGHVGGWWRDDPEIMEERGGLHVVVEDLQALRDGDECRAVESGSTNGEKGRRSERARTTTMEEQGHKLSANSDKM